jgi:hypothetical protein
MKRKIFSILFVLLLVLTLGLVTAVPAAAQDGVPTIDGVIETGEWGDPAFWNDYFYVYMLNDAEYLYVAFQTLGGTYLPTGDGTVGMMNLYVMNPETEECWAYCWIHRTPGLIQLKYTCPPDPTQTLDTDADFGVKATVFELQIPLSELSSISLGDTINLHFLSFAEGWNNWINCWLYNQEYTLAPPTKADILKGSGIPGKGLDTAPGLQKPFNPNSEEGQSRR